MASNTSRNNDDASLPQHLRRPSLPPPSGPLPPTPEASLKPAIGSPDRLIGRPFLPSSSLPLWTTKRPDASLQSIRARGPTTLPFRPSTGSRDWARHSRSGSNFRQATVVDRRLVKEQEPNTNKPISPSYPSSATLQDSLISSSSSSQRNIPLPVPPIPSARNSGEALEKAGSSYSNSTKSGSSRSSSHHRSLSQPVQGRLSHSIRRWFSTSGQMTSDIEAGMEEDVDVGAQGSGHRRNASSTLPQSQTFYSLSSSDEVPLDAHAIGGSPRPGFVANFSRKPLKAIPDAEDGQGANPPPSYTAENALDARAVGTAQSRFHTISSANSNFTRTSSSTSGLEFGYIPFLTESGNSYQANNGSNRGSQGSSRLRAGVSTEDIARDFRSLSRLSGLSHVSGGAAFIISEDGDGADYIAGTASDFEAPLPLPRARQQGPRIDSGPMFDGTGALADSEREPRQGGNGNDNQTQGLRPYPDDEMGGGKSESGIVSSMSDADRRSSSSSENGQKEILASDVGFKQLAPANMRIHPADQRYSHTYRVRQSTGDDPVLIPVYNFPTPGAFPNRNHLTMPNPNPTFAKHIRAADSVDIFDGVPPPDNDSSERLIPVQGVTSSKHKSRVSHPYATNSDSSESREKYSKSATVALMSGAGRIGHEHSESSNHSNKYRTEGSTAETDDPTSRSTKSILRPPQILPQQPKKLSGKDRFDQDHENDTIRPVESEVSVQEPKRYLQTPDLISTPHLYRAEAAYAGDEIDAERWPERSSRQQKIGRYMLVMCTILPPLWLVLAAGGLDIFVNELTEGEIWAVGQREKKIGMWLGSSFFVGLLAVIITIGIIVL